MEASSKKLGTSYGVYLGVALILITVIIYAFDISLMTEWYLIAINFILILFLSILAVKKAKKFSETLFSFKEAFSVYFLTIVIGLFIATIFSLILFNVVDPDAAETLKELSMEKQAAMMEKFGMPEDQLNEAMTKIQEEDTFSIKNIAISFASQLVFFSIIGLIIALIFREKEPTHN
ncbi:DUF4199 domain-containing protein [Gramella sp. AN32]|uniref:DUF4199 domain-containing protein n=1 Tax=Christiangramia antarctica TaxID=2058158 RepID=A0ABW5XAK4_9FLAO|nr:DUF4199 domain-containing protein [Gramella sp. AN32]MCM4156525.1 DUF4199 domain-containing protein [Gramella sp. AN32]